MMWVDVTRCTGYGACVKACPVGAITLADDKAHVDETLCIGCGACAGVCPADAIQPIVQGKLVTLVKQQARLLGQDTGAALLLIDGPPGIGCPVIAGSAGADLALHVVEPTVSGVHDLERILATTDYFGVPSLVAINKANLNPARADEIAAFCVARGSGIAGHIPYDDVVIEAMVQGWPVTEYADGPATAALRGVWMQVRERLFPDGAGER